MTRRVANRYALAEQIGAGGSARVFAAVDERLGRRVAVKMLDARLATSADPASRERFLREGPTSASFLHRHAVAVFDAGQDADDLYIVMELVDGPSLAEVLATRGALPVAEATRIAVQVLAALAAAHDAGVVHRDVKPGNILLAPDGDAKLTDFGIAKRFDDIESSVTSTGTTIGTPRYLAPEQATGSPLSPATDVYAVGAVLFEMLTGRTAIDGDTPIAVALAQQLHPAPDVRELRADVPPTVAAVVARAMARRPSNRYDSAAQMISALSGISPPPPPPPGPVPASAIPTRLMETPLDARSGDTAIMPRSDIAMVGTERPVAPASRRRSRLLIAVALTRLALAAVLRSGDNGSVGTSSTATPLGPTTAAGPTAIEPVATTTLPTTAPIVAEIIPGFPLTDDLETFLSQLQQDPALVGPAGDELAEGLGRVLRENSARKRRDGAAALTGQLANWVTAQQMDPAIAQALTQLLAPVASKGKP
jgi:serine/threonine-protein kinase